MKIAVGIIGIALSVMAFLQSFAVAGLANLAQDENVGQAGSIGVLTAFLIFLGGAFAFGLPKVARVLFVLGFLASIPARSYFPDMLIWGGVSLILGVLLLFVKSPKPQTSP